MPIATGLPRVAKHAFRKAKTDHFCFLQNPLTEEILRQKVWRWRIHHLPANNLPTTAATIHKKEAVCYATSLAPCFKKLYLHGLPMSPIKSHQVAKKIKGLIGSCMMISGQTTRAKWSLETIRSRWAWNSGKWVCCRRWAKVRYQWGWRRKTEQTSSFPFWEKEMFFWFRVFEVQGKNIANFLAINAIKIKNIE